MTIVLLNCFIITCREQQDNPGYDAALAEKLGADDYGMKKYVLVILKTENNNIKNQELINLF